MKVAIYCRVSTDDQDASKQEDMCKEYCKARGFEVVGVYKDTISGVKHDRPRFNILLDELRKSRFGGVVVTKLDRMGRSLQHLLSLVEEFKLYGVHLIATTQQIDTSSSIGKLQLQILGAFAEFERNLISERTKEALKGNVKVGKRGKDKKPRLKRGGVRKPIPL